MHFHCLCCSHCDSVFLLTHTWADWVYPVNESGYKALSAEHYLARQSTILRDNRALQTYVVPDKSASGHHGCAQQQMFYETCATDPDSCLSAPRGAPYIWFSVTPDCTFCMNGSKGSIFVAFCENGWITSLQELLTLDSCIVELRKHDLTDFCRAPLHLCARAVFRRLTIF